MRRQVFHVPACELQTVPCVETRTFWGKKLNKTKQFDSALHSWICHCDVELWYRIKFNAFF